MLQPNELSAVKHTPDAFLQKPTMAKTIEVSVHIVDYPCWLCTFDIHL